MDQAIKTVHVIDSKDILNDDVRLENFMVVPKPDKTYQVFMIDLGQCRTRRADEKDSRWKRAKGMVDEEGAVGTVMQNILKRHNFELYFERSRKYILRQGEEQRSEEMEATDSRRDLSLE